MFQSPLDTTTPVMVLGGKENSLSVVRHLGSLGVPMSCSGALDCWGMASRYCRDRYLVPARRGASDFWFDLLLGTRPAIAPGTLLYPCCDDALRFVAENHAALSQRYVFDEASPRQRLEMLDKQRTLELAQAAGVGAPRFWKVSTPGDLEKLRDRLVYPVMVKPLDSYGFAKTFGRKLFIVESDFADVADKVRLAWSGNHAVMVTEMIPGPDDLLSSYYTYITDEGRRLFDFTKRVLRRYPVNRGGATFHETRELPATAAAGQKFFEACGFRGLGTIEFKHDPRDGQLKIIEVNARFTAAQELALRAGVPVDLIKYCHLTSQQQPELEPPLEGLRYWYPLRDTLACIELHGRGELTVADWMKSVLPVTCVSPLHSKIDLLPSIFAARGACSKALRGSC